MKNVLVIGGVSYDTLVYLEQFPQPVSQTLFANGNEAVGSTGAGKAVALTKLGVPTKLQAVLGNDEAGQKIETWLKQQGVKSYYDYDPSGTERHVNLMNAAGGRISIFTQASSQNVAIDEGRFEQLLTEADVIVLNIMSYTKALIPKLVASGKPIWCDLHDYDLGNPYHQAFIEVATHLFLSSDRVPFYRELMQQWHELGKTLVVCTHGGKGATALDNTGTWYKQPAIPTSIVDTNGAGDNFFAGFLWSTLQGETTQTAMEYGSICGALAVASRQLAHEHLSSKFIRTIWQADFQK